MRQNGNPTLKPVARFGKSVGSNFLRHCWNKLRAFTGDPEPDVEVAMEHPRVTVEPLRADGGVPEWRDCEVQDCHEDATRSFTTRSGRTLYVCHMHAPDLDLNDRRNLVSDGGIERPPTQGFVREDAAGQYVVCAGVDKRGRPCRVRMRLDETASTDTRWVWACPDCEERLIQARGGRR